MEKRQQPGAASGRCTYSAARRWPAAAAAPAAAQWSEKRGSHSTSKGAEVPRKRMGISRADSRYFSLLVTTRYFSGRYSLLGIRVSLTIHVTSNDSFSLLGLVLVV